MYPSFQSKMLSRMEFFSKKKKNLLPLLGVEPTISTSTRKHIVGNRLMSKRIDFLPKLWDFSSKCSNSLNFRLTCLISRNNILFLPKGKGKNKILTRLKENSCPRGEAARARILPSEG